MPETKIVATDISNDALNIARKNAVINNVQNQMIFINSDLFRNLETQKFDIIVSNPPYIKTNVIEKLDIQVKNEPNIALDGGEDGLDFYRKIIKESYQYLKYNGYLCLEIGFDQKDNVVNILNETENFKNIYCKKDLGDNDRVVVGQVK